MKKGWIAGGVTAGILLIGGLMMGSSYNGMMEKEENVELAWSTIESQYQKRANVIPNLVTIVEQAADHEQGIYEKLTDARAGKYGVSDPDDITKANEEYNATIKNIMVIQESNPELKANGQFTALMDELTGVENRIAVETNRYSEAVTDYNKKVKKFPTNIMANMFGFDEKEKFEAEEGTEKAPEIKFGDDK